MSARVPAVRPAAKSRRTHPPRQQPALPAQHAANAAADLPHAPSALTFHPDVADETEAAFHLRGLCALFGQFAVPAAPTPSVKP